MALVLGGCLASRPVALPELQQLPPDRVLAVYRDGRGTLIDSVQVRGDTLFGRTRVKHPDGTRPLFMIPLIEADSIRTANPDRSALLLFAIPIGLIIVYALAWSFVPPMP